VTGPLHISFVLWDGTLFGGAETATIALAHRMAVDGHHPRVVFVGDVGVYRSELDRLGVEHASLGLSRGSRVLLVPRAFAELVSAGDADAAVLPSAGYLARALRVGGFAAPIVAVEHGGLLQFARRSALGKAKDIVDRTVGIGCVDAQVAVSRYMHERLMQVPHARRVEVIYNGVDVSAYRSAGSVRLGRREQDPTVAIGVAGKLMDGKGVEDVVSALASVGTSTPWRLLIAGDGPLAERLREQVGARGISDRVEFLGWVTDMPGFWARCDLAVAPSNGCIESFGMTVVEAFASGIPSLVSRSGALPEVVGDSGAGEVFEPGDAAGLAVLLERYIDLPEAREQASAAAAERAEELSIVQSAASYERLLGGLARERGGGRA